MFDAKAHMTNVLDKIKDVVLGSLSGWWATYSLMSWGIVRQLPTGHVYKVWDYYYDKKRLQMTVNSRVSVWLGRYTLG